jgi:hypothetical protein
MGAIGELCASNPERLSPLLGDARWYVVRNGVQILGTIGGRPIVGLLQAVLPHPDARVRLEIAGALRSVESTLARPLLIRLLEGADTRMFCSALTLLSQSRDSITSRILLDLMRDPGFEKRPGEEKRAIYSAIGATAEDDLLGELEMELAKGTWFARTPEPHRLAIARCIARIGTPASKEALERGVQSKRGAVRKACEDVLSRWRPRD